ncbi:hypothetical protein [Ponticoccus alexandrii]|uniref:DUF2946 domain-containing protein n=1 Tax=Ponticoccus alexandrii TaxID=1943633 RepID=A0ABX7F5U4_9RHOB|nr:hypothetical protein [Ponticoccus alexandrii]QRF65854.1 hypothetical protein GQA70_05735 [Ponticoccus alexandrii]
MTSWVSTACALLLGLILASTSVMSVSLMAPDRDSDQREAYAMIYGDAVLALCADHDSHADHDHICPFCHATPRAPELASPDLSLAFVPHDLWRQGAALHRESQGRNINHSTRAPPRIV